MAGINLRWHGCVTEGSIGRDGKQLKPPMPRFHMTKQDASDVIAYMRSLQ